MNSGPHKRICEWNDCPKEGRYRIQASADQNDIHWFCAIHARTFDLSLVNKGPFFGSAHPAGHKNKIHQRKIMRDIISHTQR